jgi:hypothetical protein
VASAGRCWRAEQWARERGHERITLETGERNDRAGWEPEEVRLSKPLS